MKNMTCFELITAWHNSKLRFSLVFLLAFTFGFSFQIYAQGEGEGEHTIECDDECVNLCDTYSNTKATYTYTTGNYYTGVTFLTPQIIDVTGDINLFGVTYTNVIFRMTPGKKISINTLGSATFNNCVFFSCTQMWKGIEMTQYTSLTMSGSQIEDAQYAINATHDSYVYLTNNVFNRNDIALLFLPTIPFASPMSINTFTGNTFKCCYALNAAFTGQSPAPLTWSRSGVQLTTGTYNIGVGAASTNVFRCLLQGAEFNYADVTMENCIFSDMRSTTSIGIGTYQQETGIAILNSYLDFTGTGGASGGATIKDFARTHKYGIYAQSSACKIYKAYFELADREIYVTGTQTDKIRIHNCYFTKSYTAGIEFADIKSAYRVLVYENHFVDHEFSHLYVNDRDNHSQWFWVELNIFEQNTTPFSTMIEHLGSTSGKIAYIENYLFNYTSTASTGLMHMHANSGDTSYVEDNFIWTGTSPSTTYAGLYMDGTENHLLCQNDLQGMSIGLEMKNNCDQSLVRVTSFGVHDIGFLADNLLLNTAQSNFGNTWLSPGNYTYYAAQYLGSSFASAYFTANASPPYFPNPVSPSSGWFGAVGGTPNSCTVLYPPTYGLSPEYRQWIEERNDDISPDNLVYRWNSLRNAFEILDQHPDLMDGDEDLTDFYLENQNAAMGILNAVRNGLVECGVPSLTQTTLIEDYNQQILDKKVEITFIDSFFINNLDTTGLQDQKSELLLEIMSLKESIKEIAEDIKTTYQLCCSGLLALNSEVESDLNFVQIEKELNAMLIQKESDGRTENTSDEFNRFNEIAAMCYVDAGTNLYRARNALMDERLAQSYEENEDNCTPIEERSRVIVSVANVTIFPNPVNDLLTIESHDGNIVSIFLYNTAGIIIKNKDEIHSSKWSVSTSNVVSGIYTVVTTLDTGEKTVQKVNIIH